MSREHIVLAEAGGAHYVLPGLVCVTTRDYSLSSTSIEFAILILDGIVIGTVYRSEEPAGTATTATGRVP